MSQDETLTNVLAENGVCKSERYTLSQGNVQGLCDFLSFGQNAATNAMSGPGIAAATIGKSNL